MSSSLVDPFSMILILVSGILSILWAIYNAYLVKKINIKDKKNDLEEQLKQKNIDELERIGLLIDEGANAFLFAEYKIMGIFILVFGTIVFFAVDIKWNDDKGIKVKFYTTISYVIGSVTSIVCGYIGMKIAVMANYRTTFMAITSLNDAFKTAFRAGCVMGFSMIGASLLILYLIIQIYLPIYDNDKKLNILMEMVSGYGLGGSSIALFGRVGGGIYTKAADVGADLVGKVEEGLNEDSPRNPATIADNVGDNVGDIAGMGSDLFGSFAESTCAALVLVTNLNLETIAENKTWFWLPLTISAVGLIACIITSVFGIYVYKVDKLEKIQKSLNIQLIMSTGISVIFLFILCLFLKDFTLSSFEIVDKVPKNIVYKKWHVMFPLIFGTISGLIIGYSTNYYTSFSYSPVKKLAKSCTSGAALNIIFGLSLGYKSNIIPVIFIVATIIIAIKSCGMFGVALAALGMLSTISVGLAIDAYGPISDNAGGIAEMSEIGEEVRTITDALDSAGNTTAAVGKGFAIGSAALVSFALYGAFNVAYGDTDDMKITDGLIFGSMLFGAMLPYAFSAMTMNSVGDAATEMVNEVRRQFQDPLIKSGEKVPDYKRCIEVSTKASLKEMIAPGLLIILTPIILGLINGKLLIGLLPGSLISGIQLAISMSNSGGAWDNAKKYIESGSYVNTYGETKGKGSYEHGAAVIGDTVGDPLKDTSGPSLNILIKLMAIISLVFVPIFKLRMNRK